jgi:hypothetical protein
MDAVSELRSRADQDGLWDMGVELSDMRKALITCSQQFYCGALKSPTGPCDPSDLEYQLGLQGSPAPSAEQLWLSDGREIDRVTLKVLGR